MSAAPVCMWVGVHECVGRCVGGCVGVVWVYVGVHESV